MASRTYEEQLRAFNEARNYVRPGSIGERALRYRQAQAALRESTPSASAAGSHPEVTEPEVTEPEFREAEFRETLERYWAMGGRAAGSSSSASPTPPLRITEPVGTACPWCAGRVRTACPCPWCALPLCATDSDTDDCESGAVFRLDNETQTDAAVVLDASEQTESLDASVQTESLGASVQTEETTAVMVDDSAQTEDASSLSLSSSDDDSTWRPSTPGSAPSTSTQPHDNRDSNGSVVVYDNSTVTVVQYFVNP